MPPCASTKVSQVPPSSIISNNDAGFHLQPHEKTIYRIIYCPRTDTTYEGHILARVSSQLIQQPSKRRSKKNARAQYVKHGKGTFHDHAAGMTLNGYFQNDQVIGHALQTLFDPLGRFQMAQYEGSFVLDDSSGTVIYLKHGKGKYTWQNTNDIYSGDFRMGEMEGKGTFIWGGTGDRYEGPFKKGRMHGSRGTKYTILTGDVFEGSWKKGQAHGWGKKEFGNGDVFTGMYWRDTRQGFGHYFWNNGDAYVGKWQNGIMAGRGFKSLVQANRSRSPSTESEFDHQDHNDAQPISQGDTVEVYNGNWDCEMAHGDGVKQYASGDEYYGSFQDDKRHGHGVYTWSNGDVYEGDFVDGRCTGQGTKRMINGDIYEGGWLDDKAHGYGVKTFANGGAHIGHYWNDERHGRGLIVWANGDEYDGDFKDGQLDGFGRYRWSNLNSYEGQWRMGIKDGPGLMTMTVHSTSRIFSEVWSKGKCISRQRVSIDKESLPSIELLGSKRACLEEMLKEHWIAQI